MADTWIGPAQDRRERRVIINADDLGLSPAVNAGIVAAHQAGRVTSASLLMNLPSTANALRLTAGTDLDVGVHLNLTVGPPLTANVPSLVGSAGQFEGPGLVVRRLALGRLRLPEVEREWSAQIEAFLATGRPLAHLDTHLHLHIIRPLSALVVRLAQRYGVGAVRLSGHGLIVRQVAPFLPAQLANRWVLPRPVGRRVLMPDQMVLLTALKPRYQVAAVQALLRSLPRGLTELVTHPGHTDAELYCLDTLRWERERELDLLHAAWWPAILAEAGVRLTTFREAISVARHAQAVRPAIPLA